MVVRKRPEEKGGKRTGAKGLHRYTGHPASQGREIRNVVQRSEEGLKNEPAPTRGRSQRERAKLGNFLGITDKG